MKSSGADVRMTIGEIAARFGLATHVLRHWQSLQLGAPARAADSRRYYCSGDLYRVAAVLRGKEAGLSLEGMHELVTTTERSSGGASCKIARTELAARIAKCKPRSTFSIVDWTATMRTSPAARTSRR